GRNLLPKAEKWRVLDLGAGVGAMGLGLLSFASEKVPGLSVQIDAVDVDQDALTLYRDALAALDRDTLDLGDISIRIFRESTAKYTIEEGAYDLVVLGSVLNELSPNARNDLAERALAGVNPEGSLIVIEPALRETSRGLHEVRDSLLQSGATVFAPCTRTSSPCPALDDSRDWCHEDRAVVLPSRARQMSQTTGLRDGGLKFSYIVMRHSAEALVSAPAGSAALRVVGQTQKSKGQKECFVCGELGRVRLRLLKRERSSENRVFEKCRRGDVLTIESIAKGEGDRIDLRKGQNVERHQPADG
ncbi:MAG: methyltransferase, partial [Kofleriaceae bacterium]|nr:methyltransferase [Kofleriaceae bacterium]